MDIKNKIVIVTGASSGIGEALARLLSSRGAKVVLAARSKEKILKLAEELPDSLAFMVDMSKEGEVKNLVKKVKDTFGIVPQAECQLIGFKKNPLW